MQQSYNSVTGTYSFVVGDEKRKGSEETAYARSTQHPSTQRYLKKHYT
jgi:hypothetical protein